MKRDFSAVKRIVIKVGTSSLTYPNGKLNLHRIDRLSRDLCDLENQGKEVVLVSSGAIAAGVNRLHLPKKPDYVSGRQAMACVGQSALMEIYNKCIADYGYNAGQLLLTKVVFDNPEMKQNFQNTIDEMMHYNVIPVINENDSISVDEIKLGDNDNLSSLVARLVNADLLNNNVPGNFLGVRFAGQEDGAALGNITTISLSGFSPLIKHFSTHTHKISKPL